MSGQLDSLHCDKSRILQVLLAILGLALGGTRIMSDVQLFNVILYEMRSSQFSRPQLRSTVVGVDPTLQWLVEDSVGEAQ